MYSSIGILELEPSSACQSFCPGCPRYLVDKNKLFKNQNVNTTSHLTVEQIKPAIDMVRQNGAVELIGTVGDPMANPNIVEIVKTVYLARKNIFLSMHTNGGLQKPEVYTKLARYINKTTGWSLVFSIDGLEDTNELYRINVKWDKIMANARAFIAAGGRAHWKCVEFNHNKHQIEEMRQLAKDMGFASFSTRENQAEDAAIDETVKDGKSLIEITGIDFKDSDAYCEMDYTLDPTMFEFNHRVFNGPMEPRCELAGYVHIRGDGKVFPCCHFAAQEANVTEFYRKQIRDLMQMHDSDWNDINHHNFKDILMHENWKKVQQNFSSDDPCQTCIIACDVNSGRKNPAPVTLD